MVVVIYHIQRVSLQLSRHYEYILLLLDIDTSKFCSFDKETPDYSCTPVSRHRPPFDYISADVTLSPSMFFLNLKLFLNYYFILANSYL